MTALLHHQIHGQGEPVILLHGLFGSLENLGVVRRGLEQNFQVISVDLPDHGRSFHTSQFSFAGYAEAIVNLMEHLNLSASHFVGHSLGGKVAMYLALNYPDKVNKLVVADIAPVAYTPRHDQIFAGLQAVQLATLSGRKDAEQQMSEHIREPGVRQFLLKSLENEQDKWAWRFNLTGLIRDYAILSEAIGSPTPFTGDTLFVKGEKSDYLQAQHQPQIVKLFPNSKARVIAGAGHWLHAEKPDLFNRAVSQFLLR